MQPLAARILGWRTASATHRLSKGWRSESPEFFESLPEDLSDYEKWLPAFRLVDGSVMILLRPKDTAAAELCGGRLSLCQGWKLCPGRVEPAGNNAVNTSEETHILARLYEEDVAALDRSIMSADLMDFTCFFV